MSAIRLNEVLTPEELDRARLLKLIKPTDLVARCICDELVAPNIDRICECIGQRCEPMYIAYAINYCLGHKFIAR